MVARVQDKQMFSILFKYTSKNFSYVMPQAIGYSEREKKVCFFYFHGEMKYSTSPELEIMFSLLFNEQC